MAEPVPIPIPTQAARPRARVTTLDPTLHLARFSRESLHLFTRPLLALLFSPTSFLSVTETDDEVSVLTDTDGLSLLTANQDPDSALQVCPQVWRALHVFVGADVLATSGVITTLTDPLARGGLPLLFLSTFDTDLLLVDEEALDEAEDLLSGHLATLIPPDSEPKASSFEDTFLDDGGVTLPTDLQSKVMLSPIENALVQVAHIPQESMTDPGVLCALVRTLLLRTEATPFLSLTKYHQASGATLMAEPEILSTIPCNDLVVDEQPWRPIRVSEGELGGLDVAGLVNVVSKEMSRKRISQLYVGTYATDFVLERLSLQVKE